MYYASDLNVCIEWLEIYFNPAHRLPVISFMNHFKESRYVNSFRPEGEVSGAVKPIVRTGLFCQQASHHTTLDASLGFLTQTHCKNSPKELTVLQLYTFDSHRGSVMCVTLNKSHRVSCVYKLH